MRSPELRAPLVVAALGLVAAAALATPSLPVPLRAVAAIALAFALPGAALTMGLLPRALLRRSERIVLGLGASITTAIGSAFLLHVLPAGLTAGAWAAILGTVTVVGGLLGWLRTSRPVAADGVVVSGPGGASSASAGGPWVVGPPGAALRELVSPSAIAMLAAAGVMVVLALAIARAGVALGPTASFSELWMLPMDGGTAVRVGIANHEGVPETYRLELTMDGKPLRDPATVTVASGGATDAIVELPGGVEVNRMVEARLWRADQAATDPPDRLVRVEVRMDAGAAP